jgi:hypothetical protein
MFRSVAIVTLALFVSVYAAEKKDDSTVNEWIRSGYETIKKSTGLKYLDWLPSPLKKGVPDVSVDDLLAAKDVAMEAHKFEDTEEFVKELQSKSPKVAKYAQSAAEYAKESLDQLEKNFPGGKTGGFLKKLTNGADELLTDVLRSFEKAKKNDEL